MIARYQIRRGQPLSSLPARLRQGLCFDTRMHTRHCLRPSRELVQCLFAGIAEGLTSAWREFERGYRALLAARFAADRGPFDELCALARDRDVFLGCSCPTAINPDVRHCHTTLALRFLREHYPGLAVDTTLG